MTVLKFGVVAVAGSIRLASRRFVNGNAPATEGCEGLLRPGALRITPGGLECGPQRGALVLGHGDHGNSEDVGGHLPPQSGARPATGQPDLPRPNAEVRQSPEAVIHSEGRALDRRPSKGSGGQGPVAQSKQNTRSLRQIGSPLAVKIREQS